MVKRVEFNLESAEFESRGENESRYKCVTIEMEDVSGGHDECGFSHNSESNVGSDNLQMFRDIHFWEITCVRSKMDPLKLLHGKIIKKLVI